jgi:signal transduction histidine kinase
VVVSFTDITEQRRVEQSLMESRRQSEQMLRDMEKLSAKSQMAAFIAHEINNPLAGIRNAFLLLEGAIPAAHPHRSYVPLIQKEIDRIGSIIRTMYHVYRPPSGPPRKVSMDEVFEDLESLLRPKCRAKGVRIRFGTAELGETGILSEGVLRQVLFNLVQNAVEASPQEGEVEVSARTHGRSLELAVLDQGPGIPPEWAERVFEPGFTTKQDKEMSGLGLGLSTCRSLVEGMGGTLAFAPRNPGPGVGFTVRIPFSS